jgi:Tfp pilus assembly protein PilF
MIRLFSAAVILGLTVVFAGCMGLATQTRDPLTLEEHLTLGELYLKQGLHQPARREYEAALRRSPDHVEALLALGAITSEQKEWNLAQEYYRRVLEVAPDNVVALNNLAMVYVATDDRLEEAENLAKKALQQSTPLKPYVYDTLARVYLRQGRRAEAEAVRREAEAAGGIPDPTAGTRAPADRRS